MTIFGDARALHGVRIGHQGDAVADAGDLVEPLAQEPLIAARAFDRDTDVIVVISRDKECFQHLGDSLQRLPELEQGLVRVTVQRHMQDHGLG